MLKALRALLARPKSVNSVGDIWSFNVFTWRLMWSDLDFRQIIFKMFLRYAFQRGNTEDREMSYEVQYSDDEWAQRERMKLRNFGHDD